MGYFTLDEDCMIALVGKNMKGLNWLVEMLGAGKGQKVKAHQISPSLEALKAHWIRIGLRSLSTNK